MPSLNLAREREKVSNTRPGPTHYTRTFNIHTQGQQALFLSLNSLQAIQYKLIPFPPHPNRFYRKYELTAFYIYNNHTGFLFL